MHPPIYRQTNQSNKWLCQWIGGHVSYPIYSLTATWPGQDCLAVHLWDEGFAQGNNWDHCLFSLPILCFPWNMQTGFFYVVYGYTLTSWWIVVIYVNISFNSSRLGQNDHYFGRWQFQMHFFYENDVIPLRISLKFVPRSPINNKPALVQVIAWHQTGDKPLPEPMLTQLTDAYMQHWGEMSQSCFTAYWASVRFTTHCDRESSAFIKQNFFRILNRANDNQIMV